ncbi:MAG: hypothetical protein E7420_02210 [Ruminococcaceae bacterium]|nr:hypothetical protein [Oscillospiraceae bacterium]
MAFIELINFKKIRKALWYLLCVIISISLQNLLCSRIALFGVHAFFIPVVVIAFGVFEGAVWGASLGLITGYFCDITMLESTVLFMVLFAALGFAAGFLAEFIINRRFFSYFVLALSGLILTVICQIVPLWIFKGTSLLQLLPTMILQILWSAPFTVPAYFAVKAVSIKRKEEDE